MVAVTLLALALFLVFKIPHGFEEQVGWYLVLLPASVFAAGISQFIGKLFPPEQYLAFRGLLVWLQFPLVFPCDLRNHQDLSLCLAHIKGIHNKATIEANSHLSDKRVNRPSAATVRFDNFLEPRFWILQRNR